MHTTGLKEERVRRNLKFVKVGCSPNAYPFSGLGGLHEAQTEIRITRTCRTDPRETKYLPGGVLGKEKEEKALTERKGVH